MNLKQRLGNFIIILVSILTIVMWFIVRKGTETFSNYDVSTHSLGQLSGLVGMTLFALSFILTTRMKILEDLFGGLDKVYRSHHIVGIIAFILILFHPLLLVIKFIPSEFSVAANYLLPSSSWGINLGIIALISMIILIVLTIYINLKYQVWKGTHRLMGVVFIVATLHVFMITTDVTNYSTLWGYMAIICFIGLISYIYGSFLRERLNSKYIYVVDSVINPVKDITAINLKPKKERLRFKPGQFVFIKFYNSISKESHPFSIASSPNEEILTLIIKNLGDYTKLIPEIKKGTIATIEGPYGRTNYKDHLDKSQVWIGGGIGITPFLSMVESLKEVKLTKEVFLYYCVRNKKEMILFDELTNLSKKINHLKFIPYYSDEKGHLTVEEIKKTVGDLTDKKFIICGPPMMMDDLSKNLRKQRVSKKDILMEDFGFK